MANSDVKVREVRLLESYSEAYGRFFESNIHTTYHLAAALGWKLDKAREYLHHISDSCHYIHYKMVGAKADVEASMRRGGGMDGRELQYRQETYQKFKALYQKAQQYEEIAKKLYQNIQIEVRRGEEMCNSQRNKMEQNREEGMNFLKKAISALNDYKQ